jgi:hypothetical protein
MLVTPRYQINPEGQVLRLTPGREYEVLALEADWYRLLNDADDPVLYSPDDFLVLDPAEPEFWQCRVGDEGERYASPEPWAEPGFFEDVHDRVPAASERFREVLNRFFPKTANRMPPLQ